MSHELPATSGGRPQGQMERALIELTLGVHRGRVARERALKSTRQGEYDQQIQVAFSGVATGTFGFADVPVTWEHPFIFAPLQRDPQFETPLVTSHIEFQQDSGELVIAHAHVVRWNIDSRGWYIGATVRVAVCAPTATGNVPYAAVAHLNFQGFASPTDEDMTL